MAEQDSEYRERNQRGLEGCSRRSSSHLQTLMKMFDAEVESRDLFFTLGTYGVPTNAPEWMGQLAAVATVLRECAQQGYALDVVEGQGVIRSTLGRTVFFPKSMFHRVLAFMGRLRGSSDTTLRVLPT